MSIKEALNKANVKFSVYNLVDGGPCKDVAGLVEAVTAGTEMVATPLVRYYPTLDKESFKLITLAEDIFMIIGEFGPMGAPISIIVPKEYCDMDVRQFINRIQKHSVEGWDFAELEED